MVLDHHGIGKDTDSSWASSEPVSLVSPRAAPLVTTDPSESSWEEMEQTLTNESHFTGSTAALMFIAGFCAATGIATGSLHVVAGGMVIAPGFEPLVRVALGGITGSRAWTRGLFSAAGGYAVMMLGAAVAAAILSSTGTSLLRGNEGYIATAELVKYWSVFSVGSVTVSALAGVAGALLVVAHRSVLTAGVMLALALVPSAALVPLAAIGGDFSRAGMALFRWIADVVLVLVTAAAVFAWHQARRRRRQMRL